MIGQFRWGKGECFLKGQSWAEWQKNKVHKPTRREKGTQKVEKCKWVITVLPGNVPVWMKSETTWASLAVTWGGCPLASYRNQRHTEATFRESVETREQHFLFRVKLFKSASWILGFSRWFSGKESACRCKSHRRQVWSSGERNGNPLRYFCLEDPMDRGAWRAIVHEVAKSQTRLSNWAHTHVYFGARGTRERGGLCRFLSKISQAFAFRVQFSLLNTACKSFRNVKLG